MIEVLKQLFIIAALTFIGCLCGFFIVLNYIKQEERRKENEDGKTK